MGAIHSTKISGKNSKVHRIAGRKWNSDHLQHFLPMHEAYKMMTAMMPMTVAANDIREFKQRRRQRNNDPRKQ